MRRGGHAQSTRVAGRQRGYSSSPLLAARTPVWRSQAARRAVRLGLRRRWPAARSGCRSSATTSSRSRARCASPARWNCRPTAAGSWTATARCWPPACRCQAIWAIPRRATRDPAKLAQLAQLLEHAAGRAATEARPTRTRTSSGSSARSTRTSPQRSRKLEHRGHRPAQGIQAPVPGGRSGGARGRLHQRRGHGPGRHGAGLPEGRWPAAPAAAA